jgi:hypothetical protein
MPQMVVELVRLGFHGLALVMLFLGYRLIRQVLTGKADVAQNGFDQSAKLFSLRLTGVAMFLGVSLIFFILGVGSELMRHSQENDVIVYFSPKEMPGEIEMPILVKGMEPVHIHAETGAAMLRVKHKETLSLQLEVLTNELGRVRALVDRLTEERDSLLAATGGSSEMGSDDV